MSDKKLITPRGACEQKLSTAETTKLATLHTAYQQAFLDEKTQRDITNGAIADLRRTERALRDAAIELASYRQMNALDVPQGFSL